MSICSHFDWQISFRIAEKATRTKKKSGKMCQANLHSANLPFYPKRVSMPKCVSDLNSLCGAACAAIRCTYNNYADQNIVRRKNL